MATNEGGVWRTVGGRRIFIKDGEDLATAMKNSGKFKGNKKQKLTDSDEDREIKGRMEELQREIDSGRNDKEKTERLKDELQQYKDTYETSDKEARENDKKLEEQKKEPDFLKNATDEEKENYYKNMAEKEKMQKMGTTAYLQEKQREKGNYQDEKTNSLQKKANEIAQKLKENKEADFEKNIDEMYNRFHGKTDKEVAEEIAKERGERLLTDEEQKAREVQFMKDLEKEVGTGKTTSQAVPKTESAIPQKMLDNAVELNEIAKRTGRSDFFSEAGKKWNKLYKEDKTNIGYDLKDGYKARIGYNGGIQISSNHAYNDTQYSYAKANIENGKIKDWTVTIPGNGTEKVKTVSEALNTMKTADKWIDSGEKVKDYEGVTSTRKPKTSYEDFKKGNSSSNDWVRDAFNKYKKEHPNSKMTLSQFKKENKEK